MVIAGMKGQVEMGADLVQERTKCNMYEVNVLFASRT